VAAAVAQSLAFGLDVPLLPFCSPLAFLPPKEGRFAYPVAAKKEAFFLLTGRKTASTLHYEIPSALLHRDELPPLLGGADFVVAHEPFPGGALTLPPELDLLPLARHMALRADSGEAAPQHALDLIYFYTVGRGTKTLARFPCIS
jgi:tRNA A37 threonylcarbamoyladenosine modification protein TsaB